MPHAALKRKAGTPTMKLQLLLADRCPTCLATEIVWKRVSAEFDQPLEVLDAESDTGRPVVRHSNLQMFPALLADGRVCAVGTPSEGAARDVLRRLLDVRPPARR